MSESIIDYVKQELRTFSTHPFHDVDSLVLSQFSYIHLGNMVAPPCAGISVHSYTIAQLYRAECFDYYFSDQIDAQRNQELLCACAASPRFRDIRITCYLEDFDPVMEKQFCAMTFLLPDGRAYIAFRGTDCTLIGWKEDFNMAYLAPVPSQENALQYVRQIADLLDGRLLLGGHSKGGNLALYAALCSPPALQRRIDAIYSHDGPGFREQLFSSADYAPLQARIFKTVPQASLVGMLLEHTGHYKIIESESNGILQHNPYSWIIRDGHFIVHDTLTNTAEFLNRTLSDWLENLDHNKREEFIEALYSVINTPELSSFSVMTEQSPRERAEYAESILEQVSKNIRSMDSSTRQMLKKTVRMFMRTAVKNLPTPETHSFHIK